MSKNDLALAFDGDGDQQVVLNSGGKSIRADRLLLRPAKQVLQARPGTTILFDAESAPARRPYCRKTAARRC